MSDTPNNLVTIDVPTMAGLLAAGKAPDILFWVGCAGAFDQRYQKVTQAFIRILHHVGINYAVLGPEESCTGDPARRAGDEMTFNMQALANIEVLNGYEVKRIVTDGIDDVAIGADVGGDDRCGDAERSATTHDADASCIGVQRDDHVGIAGSGLTNETLISGVGFVVTTLHCFPSDSGLVERGLERGGGGVRARVVAPGTTAGNAHVSSPARATSRRPAVRRSSPRHR